MKFFRLVLTGSLLGCFLAGTGSADEKQFIERWKNYDEQIMVNDDFSRYYAVKKELSFSELEEYRGPLRVPSEAGPDIETALVLHSDQDITLLLVTPKNVMKDMIYLNEDYRKMSMSCANDRSWIVVLPENEWTAVSLNPYCAMNYREDSIFINLYWADTTAPPLIDFVTDNLECVPHYLYGWDRNNGEYIPAAAKCTGAKRLESYGEAGPDLQQVFP